MSLLIFFFFITTNISFTLSDITDLSPQIRKIWRKQRYSMWEAQDDYLINLNNWVVYISGWTLFVKRQFHHDNC